MDLYHSVMPFKPFSASCQDVAQIRRRVAIIQVVVAAAESETTSVRQTGISNPAERILRRASMFAVAVDDHLPGSANYICAM